jgi:uncharacterized ubiquitin-like protein YukD
MKKKTNAQKHEEKGDGQRQKGNAKKALEQYKLSIEEDPENLELYDKLIEAHDEIKKDWGEEDFADHLSWMMKKQELENPVLTYVHERLSPEYESIRDLIIKLFQAEDVDQEEELMQHIIEFDTRAILPLIDFILNVKKISQDDENSEESDGTEES